MAATPTTRSSPYRSHWLRITILLLLIAAYVVGMGLGFGWTRMVADWWPLDRSVDGPNLLVSLIWVPLAIVAGLAWADFRHATHRLEDEQTHLRHLAELEAQHVRHMEEHRLTVASLLGVAADAPTTTALDATPADRAIP